MNIKTFVTPKGTQLPLLKLQGKDYLQVMHRLLWFREDHPDWNISSFIIESNDKYAVCRTIITDSDQRPIAQSHGREDYGHFKDYIEKAETKSVGRALGICGYGTQFAQELDEEHRIVDSPAPNKPQPQDKVTAESLRSQIVYIVSERQLSNIEVKHLIQSNFGEGTMLADLDVSQLKTLLHLVE